MQPALQREIAERLARDPLVRLALLFGSAAGGKDRPGSDLDIAVAGDRALSAGEKTRLIEQLAQLTGRPVDLVDLQSAEGPILRQALTKGRPIHCADRALYARLIVRMLVDEADMAPYRRRILAERRKAWTGA
ncbi:MAG: nucleotidyltransferase domain-containing protein [Betaproteobacteria bacterium]|nr:nucleotidyltransferase domain-containing protein [Betaproteobacteria bacterium]